MVAVYVTLIINHRKTIDQVPATIRAAVIERLIEEGYDTEGNKINADSETP